MSHYDIDWNWHCLVRDTWMLSEDDWADKLMVVGCAVWEDSLGRPRLKSYQIWNLLSIPCLRSGLGLPSWMKVWAACQPWAATGGSGWCRWLHGLLWWGWEQCHLVVKKVCAISFFINTKLSLWIHVYSSPDLCEPCEQALPIKT